MSKIKRVGIECESIEGKNPMWGVGRTVMKLLQELPRRPELEKEYCFVLYFKDSVPDFDFLKAPIFETKLTPVPFFSAKGGSASGGKNRLFPIYYFALLPMRLWFDRPDVMFWPNYMLPIIAFGKSVVTLTEDVYYETHNGKLPFRYRLAYKIFCWWTAKFATKIMAISETSKKNLANLYHIEPERIVVNCLGVDLLSPKSEIRNFKAKVRVEELPRESPPKQIRNSKSENVSNFKNSDLDIVSNFDIRASNFILFVGQMFPRRHARETILAFEKLTAEHSNILENVGMSNLKLVLVGPDKYPEPIINSLVAQINKRLNQEVIVHKDYVEDSELVELYTGARALIYVSDREAFGLPPMEALSFGVPPVIADNELGHELFGEFAFYVPASDNNNIPTFSSLLGCHSPDKIAETIKQALTDRQKIDKIKSEGPEFVKKYNWKTFADGFLDIIKS